MVMEDTPVNAPGMATTERPGVPHIFACVKGD